ncbi:MAG: DUF4276 family protein [bacterium]
MKIVILCEGQSEEQVLKPLIKPFMDKVASQGQKVGLKPHRIPAGNFFKQTEKHVYDSLTKYDNVLAVFSIYDLYNFPCADSMEKMGYRERVISLKNYLKNKVNENYREKFFPHFAVHETEAWLYAYPECTKGMLGKTLPSDTPPEQINFGENTHPSKRLEEFFRTNNPTKKRYLKTTHGPKLFEKIIKDEKVDQIRKECEHFNQLVQDLLRLCR